MVIHTSTIEQLVCMVKLSLSRDCCISVEEFLFSLVISRSKRHVIIPKHIVKTFLNYQMPNIIVDQIMPKSWKNIKKD